MKLKNKIHISSSLLTLVILILITLVIYFSFSQLSYSTEVERLQSEVNSLVSTFNTNEAEDPETVLRAYVPVNGLVKVVGPEGELIPQIQHPSVTVSLPIIPEETSGTIRIDGELFAYVTAPIIWTDGSVVELAVAQSLSAVTDNMQTLRFVLLAVTMLAMIPIIISSRVIGKVVTLPITNMTNTMNRIQQNGRFEKLPDSDESQDELGQMARTFNEMMALLEENYRKQEEFVSNASHELKTPLTVIGSYAKLLERQGLQDENIAQEGLSAIQAETDRMKTLIEQLLHIARRNETSVELENVNIVELLEQSVTAMNTSYDREFELIYDQYHTNEMTDVVKFRQLIYILLDNARKYSSEKIEVVVTKQNHTKVQIRDYGIGIPKESLPYVFDRFYRVDKARSRETGGFGLGLSLAKELADSLNLGIEIESIEQTGTTVTIVFSPDSNEQPLQSEQEGL